ncbi:MAG TPA: hypothetical protein VF502_11975 [Stellaceae bacterium]
MAASMMQQRPKKSGGPPSQPRNWPSRLGHGLGVAGVIMSAAAILTGIDPGHWIRLFPWDGTRVLQTATGLVGFGMVLMAQKLVNTNSSRAGRKGRGD